MRSPAYAGQFRRDAKRMQKRGKDMAKLRTVIEMLLAAEALPPRLKDHPLSGDWAGFRDCHVEPDWVLVYKIDSDRLILARTGTHSDLFKR